MFGKAWKLGTESVTSFINDGALSRGAAIAFYTVTSIGPVLLIVVAIAGLSFGQDAARGAIALIVALLWIYYSTQIFLLGAEFTKVYAHHHGSQQPVPHKLP